MPHAGKSHGHMYEDGGGVTHTAAVPAPKSNHTEVWITIFYKKLLGMDVQNSKLQPVCLNYSGQDFQDLKFS